MKFISSLKKISLSRLPFFDSSLDKKIDKQNILLGTILSELNNQIKNIDNLSSLEFSVFSQFGEDGIISWLINRFKIPKTFIEFGVENYRESNTRFLLQYKNWSGLIIDGSAHNINNIVKQDIYWKYDLQALNAFITKENINHLIMNSTFKDEIGILSIDIDGNDYWIWDAITVINPVVVVCEYNAVLGDMFPLTIPYSTNFIRSKAHYSNLYFGASIQALIHLAKRKGYAFIGTTSTGANAFFIKETYAHSITSLLESVSAYPSKFREARDEKGDLQFTSGIDRKEIIKDLPFLNLNTGEVGPLGSYGEIYSSSWQKGESVNF